jgi:hypothetical protein
VETVETAEIVAMVEMVEMATMVSLLYLQLALASLLLWLDKLELMLVTANVSAQWDLLT